MHRRASKTAYELQDLIVEESRALHGPWPPGMTLFVFDDAYGWTGSISRSASVDDFLYRAHALTVIEDLKDRFDLAVPLLSNPDSH